MIGPTDLLHPSPAPHFKTKQSKYLSIFSIAANKQFEANFIGQQPVSTLEIKLFAKCV